MVDQDDRQVGDGPRPGGMRLGRWYFNRRDLRPHVRDRWGLSLKNRAHRANWLRLLEEVVILLFALGAAVIYLIQRFR